MTNKELDKVLTKMLQACRDEDVATFNRLWKKLGQEKTAGELSREQYDEALKRLKNRNPDSAKYMPKVRKRS